MSVVNSDMMEAVVGPLQEKMDDWKKSASTLDKDHAKGDLYLFNVIPSSYSYRLSLLWMSTVV